MKSRRSLCSRALILAVLFHAPVSAASEPIATRTAVADGVKLQYLTAGHGLAILLLSSGRLLSPHAGCLFSPLFT